MEHDDLRGRKQHSKPVYDNPSLVKCYDLIRRDSGAEGFKIWTASKNILGSGCLGTEKSRDCVEFG